MPTPGYDPQAGSYDRRAGLPPEAAVRVAAAVAQAARPFVGAEPGGGVLVEVGAGTGVIGADLARLVPRYLGLDLSFAMLRRFRAKLAGEAPVRRPVHLVQADADAPWPLPGGPTARAGALFLSRVAHLLAPEHLMTESLRVTRAQGAVLVLGGVRRDEGSVRSRMRREMRRLLAEVGSGAGVEGRSRERTRRRLVEAFEARGGRAEPAVSSTEAAAWERSERPAEALAAWRGKPGLAGREVPGHLQIEVLDRLEAWARSEWGDLHRAHRTTESYEITVIRLPTPEPPP